MMLEIKNLSVNYGHITALQGASLSAEEGSIVSIIGANGAGKSTLLRTISGLTSPKSGSSILFCGKEIVNMAPHRIVRAGIVHVPEGRKVFAGLSVLDNLKIGGFLYKGTELQKTLDKVLEMFPILAERKDQFAATLSGGEQQMLAIGRGLMAQPKMLLLDEPSLGLAPIVINTVFRMINEIRDSGVTILLVEQNARKALTICDRAYVLENGVIRKDGTGQQLLNDPDVISAFLGESV